MPTACNGGLGTLQGRTRTVENPVPSRPLFTHRVFSVRPASLFGVQLSFFLGAEWPGADGAQGRWRQALAKPPHLWLKRADLTTCTWRSLPCLLAS